MGQKLVYRSYSVITALFLQPFRLPRFRFDGIGEIFDLRETLEHADTVALDIKDITIAEGIKEDMGQKLFY